MRPRAEGTWLLVALVLGIMVAGLVMTIVPIVQCPSCLFDPTMPGRPVTSGFPCSRCLDLGRITLKDRYFPAPRIPSDDY